MRPAHLLLATVAVAATGCRSGSRQPPVPDGAAVEPVRPEARPVKPVPPSPDDLLANERNSVDVFRRAAPSTVFVTENRLVRDRWSLRPLEVPAGTGSGWVWDDRGHIVTNYHVVAQGSSFDITLDNGTSMSAKLVGVDPTKDIAVLRVAPDVKLAPLELVPADDALIVGQKAIAIGNPFGLDHTLTVGVISAIGREVKGIGSVTIRDMIQTDAAINPGNSGGPLLNSAGELIGMNTMIYSKSGGSAGIGFAVPVSALRRVVPQIIQFGRPIRAGLGVELVADNIAAANDIDGLVILSVRRGSPAESAGIIGLQAGRYGPTLGDVIVEIDGTAVTRYDDFFQVLDRRKPGESVEVKLVRNGRVRSVKLQLIAER
jgi:S1-C subfamily serine protease